MDYDDCLYETELEKKFAGNDKTVFIRFHGTEDWLEEPIRRLEIDVSKFFESAVNYDELIMFKKKFNATKRKEPYDYEVDFEPDRILIEYIYNGEKPIIDDSYFQTAFEKQNTPYEYEIVSFTPSKIYHPDDNKHLTKGKILTNYLFQPIPTEEDIREFHRVHSKTLNEIIKSEV